MHKVLLVGVSALALSSVTATADPISTITDSGNNNDSTVDQSLAISGSPTTSNIIQAAGSSDNSVVILQADGGGTSATVNQNAAAFLNQVTISQAGIGTQSVDVIQNGDSDQAIVDQTDLGGAGASTIIIDQNDAANLINFVDAFQEGREQSLLVTQRGFDNESISEQIGEKNQLTVSQTGNSNFSNARQGELFSPGVSGNKTTVTQLGNDNTNQLEQFGDNNTATIDQLGDGNSLIVAQLGAGNKSISRQDGMYGSGADVTQSADDVISNLYQYGDGGHMAEITQNIGADGAISMVNQAGAANTAYVTQSLAGASSTVIQLGNNGMATVLQ